MQGISAIEVATKNCKRFAWASVCEEAATRRTADGRARGVKKAEGTAQKKKTATMSRADKFRASEIYQMTT